MSLFCFGMPLLLSRLQAELHRLPLPFSLAKTGPADSFWPLTLSLLFRIYFDFTLYRRIFELEIESNRAIRQLCRLPNLDIGKDSRCLEPKAATLGNSVRHQLLGCLLIGPWSLSPPLNLALPTCNREILLFAPNTASIHASQSSLRPKFYRLLYSLLHSQH